MCIYLSRYIFIEMYIFINMYSSRPHLEVHLGDAQELVSEPQSLCEAQGVGQARHERVQLPHHRHAYHVRSDSDSTYTEIGHAY